MLSICLTIHNKEQILERVLSGIFKNCTSPFELIALLDGCTDDSEKILFKFLDNEAAKYPNFENKVILFADNIFETKANNKCMRHSSGKYICIIQDDQIITQPAFEASLITPFKYFNDVFAVTGRCAHNWKLNPDSRDIKATEPPQGRWSDILLHTHHANKETITDRNTGPTVFAVRDSVNRGPLLMKTLDVRQLNYLDEVYSPLMFCEHDLMFRAKKELGKVCGYVYVGWESKPEWGGTRDENGNTKQWAYDADFKNAKIFAERWKDRFEMKVENRNMF